DGIAIRARLPQVLRNAGFVDQVPRQKRNVAKTADNGSDQGLLFAPRFRTPIRIYPAKNIGKKSEEVELHREAVLPRRHQVGFESTQRALIRLAVFVAEFVPARPPTRAQHVESGGLDLCHVAVPHIHVGGIEIETLPFAGHISSADNAHRWDDDFQYTMIY